MDLNTQIIHKLEPFYLMNVFLYIDDIEDFKKLYLISKSSQEAIKCMKINPCFEFNGDLENSQEYIKLLYKLFPNIQTIQLDSLEYVIPQSLLSHISFIRLSKRMKLKIGRRYDHFFDNNAPTFKTSWDEYYHYPISFEYTPNYQVDTTVSYYVSTLGHQIFSELNKEIMSKFQEFDVYNFGTATFLVSNYNLFTGIRTLSIVIDREIKTESNVVWDYNLEVMAMLFKIKTLKNVFIHSVTSAINSEYLNYIKTYPFINFSFIIYTFLENECDTYDLINSLPNCRSIFNCFNMNLLCNGHNFAFDTVENATDLFESIKLDKLLLMNSTKMNYLTKTLEIIPTTPKYLCLEQFDMNSKLDISKLNLITLKVFFRNVNPFDFIIPSTLETLQLEIDKNSIFLNSIPKLFLTGTSLKSITLKRFKYKDMWNISVDSLPNSISLHSCSNISFISNSNTISKNDYFISKCENITISSKHNAMDDFLVVSNSQNIKFSTPTSIFDNTNDVISKNLRNIDLKETRCLNFKFESIINITLRVITPFINIQYPTSLKQFKLCIVPNINNVVIPTQSNILHPITSLSCPELELIELIYVTDKLMFTLPNSIKQIHISNCNNVSIRTLKECYINYFDYYRNTNCHIQNVTINYAIDFENVKEFRSSGVKFNDVIVYNLNKYNIVYDDESENDYDNGNFKTLMESATILGGYTFADTNFDTITLPDSIQTINLKINVIDHSEKKLVLIQ
ncbi:hypothetical protein QTN25_004614 [Entamoeba marina]